jgi:hypothetical protein
MKQNVNFNFQAPAMYSYVFLVFFTKVVLLKVVHALGIPWSHADWCKFCIHLLSVNIRYIKMVEAMGLKIMAPRSP